MDISYQLVMAVQYLAIVALIIELFYTLCQHSSDTQKHVIMLIMAALLMFVGYVIELNAPNLEVALTGVSVSYIGKPFVMISALMFLCSFYNIKISNKLYIASLIYCSGISLIVLTNKYHYLYYDKVWFDTTQKYSPLGNTDGPLYYLYIVTVVVFFVACLYVIIKGNRENSNENDKSLKKYSIGMVLSGVVGYIVYLTGITNGYDFTMFGIFGSVIFLFLIFVKCRVFELVALAKEHALENSPTALFVYNQNKGLAYQNKLAKELIKDKNIYDLVDNGKISKGNFSSNGETYSITRNKMYDNGSYLGESVELSNITSSYNYQIKLEKEVKSRTKELEKAQREIIASVAYIVEARSVETGEHIQRTSGYTRIIANALRRNKYYTETLNDDYIELLVSAAPLHDIGKISIPDMILLKPGQLTDSEFEIMKTHSENGAKIIDNSLRNLESDEYIQMAIDIARHHHERWDGTGYPCKLEHENIPLSARIVALADTFDALCSVRCYKPAFERAVAIEILKEERGTHFEPIMVDVFVEALNHQDIKETEDI